MALSNQTSHALSRRFFNVEVIFRSYNITMNDDVSPPTTTSPRPTLTRIAHELGVSAKTVSNAFNHPDQLSAELRERILSVARRIGYPGPDPLARALRRGRQRMIGVLYDSQLSYAFDDPSAVTFLAGVSDIVEPATVGLLLVPGHAGSGRNPEAIADTLIDGVIAYSLAEDDPVLAAIRTRGLPVVTVDQPRLVGVPWVGIDDQTVAGQVAKHLVDLGHQKIGVISFGMNRQPDRKLHRLASLPIQTYQVSAHRLAGIQAVLAPLSASGTVFVAHMADSTEEEGATAARLLLAKSRDLTALICLSDRLAIGAAPVANMEGRPIAITGFDDIPLAALNDPPLTTIRQPHREKGRFAARQLFQLLEGDRPEASIQLDAELVVRASSTFAPGES